MTIQSEATTTSAPPVFGEAVYFDGRSNRKRKVALRLEAALEIFEQGLHVGAWPYGEVRSVHGRPGTMRLRCTKALPLARLEWAGVCEPPWGEGARKSKIHPGAIPGNWSETISGGEEVLAQKWGGLFLGYLLGRNYRRRDRDHLVPPGGWLQQSAVPRCAILSLG